MGLLGGKKVLNAGIQYSRLLDDSTENPAWKLMKEFKLDKQTPCMSLKYEFLKDDLFSKSLGFKKAQISITDNTELFMPTSTVKTKQFDKYKLLYWLKVEGYSKYKLLGTTKGQASQSDKVKIFLKRLAGNTPGYTYDIDTDTLTTDGTPRHFLNLEQRFSYNADINSYTIIENIIMSPYLKIPFTEANSFIEDSYTVYLTYEGTTKTIAIADSEINLDLDSSGNTVMTYPIFPIRVHSQNINGVPDSVYSEIWTHVDNGTCSDPEVDCSTPPATATTEEYIETSKAFRMLGIDLNGITSGLCISPSLNDVTDAFVLFSLDMRSEEMIVKRAIFKTIKLLANDSEIKPNDIYNIYNLNHHRYNYTPSVDRVISEELTLGTYNYKIECTLNYSKGSRTGVDIGHTSTTLVDTEYTIKQQVTVDTYEEYMLKDFKISSVVIKEGIAATATSVLAQDSEDDVFVPLFEEVTAKTPLNDMKVLYQNSLYLNIFSGQISKIPWYATGLGKVLIGGFLIVLNVVTFGASTPLTLSYIAISLAVSIIVNLQIKKLMKKAQEATIAQNKAIAKISQKLEDKISGKTGHDEDMPVIAMSEIVNTVLTEDSYDIRPSEALRIAKGSILYNTEILYRNCNKYRYMKSIDKNNIKD